ncbi:MAG: LamG-like jellyroll fold domain-containing protein, partial [Candidatus Paceibacterota bacterium]
MSRTINRRSLLRGGGEIIIDNLYALKQLSIGNEFSGNISDLNNSNPFSFEIRVRRELGVNELFSFKDLSGNKILRGYTNGTGSVGYRLILEWIDSGGTNRFINDENRHPLTEWFHIVGTFDVNSKFQIFVYGFKRQEEATNISFSSAFDKLFLRQDLSGNNVFRALRIYNKVLTQTEINDLYNETSKEIQPIPSTAQSNLLREFVMNQASGLQIVESIENNLTLVTSDNTSQYSEGGGAWIKPEESEGQIAFNDNYALEQKTDGNDFE